MKKLAFVLAVAISLSMMPSIAGAAQLPISVVVDGTRLTFPDAKPFVDSNSRTQTPAKFIGEALGAKVTWDSKAKKAKFVLGAKELVLFIGKKDYTVNGKKKQMDTAALIKNNRTFVPAKYVAEAFGATVKWDSGVKTVYVNTSKSTNPILTSIKNTFSQGKATEDLAVVMMPNGNTFKGIIGLTEGTDYTVLGNIVKIQKNYLNSLAVGKKALTFDFGLASNPVLTLTITVSLEVKVGTISGKTGDIVKVPVTLTNVAKVGHLGTCNLYLEYDPAILEAVSVTAGDIVKSPVIDFASSIDSTTGKIRCVFIDNTIGSQLITSDGELATISFKIKGTSSVTAPITFSKTANTGFTDGSKERVDDVTLVEGSVKAN